MAIDAEYVNGSFRIEIRRDIQTSLILIDFDRSTKSNFLQGQCF